MSNQKKTHELIRQNEQIVKKSQKHDANLQKNSTLYFQIGLIVCLLAAFGLLEMRFENTIPIYGGDPPLDEPYSIDIPIIKPEPPTIETPVEQKQKKPSKPKIVDNNFDANLITNIVLAKPSLTDKPIDAGSIEHFKAPDTIEHPFNMTDVEIVPIYPGCEKANNRMLKERIKCMSGKLNKAYSKKV